MVDILSMTKTELEAFLASIGAERFRAAQVFDALHGRGARAAEELTGLPKPLKARIAEEAGWFGAGIVKCEQSADNMTRKYLLELENRTIMNGNATHGNVRVESVFMRHGYGATACVSTQAGCRMGCAFCVSALGGLERNLTPGEMLAQVYAMSRDAGERISRVVLMGSGEPLDNMANVLRFIELLNEPRGANIGMRRVTVSTCGLSDKIDELAKRRLQLTLAVSLHAPNDEVRLRVMPVAKRHPMDELLAACGRYGERTGRRVSFEYALIKGLNDGAAHARELAGRIKPLAAHVNLIRLNKGRDGLAPADQAATERFAGILREANVQTTLRRSLGGDISAACGQLKNTIRS